MSSVMDTMAESKGGETITAGSEEFNKIWNVSTASSSISSFSG